MNFKLIVLILATIGVLQIEAFEDSDLITHCGDAKALALGLPPSKSYLPSIRPHVHLYSQPQVHLQPQIQPELHIKSVAYTTPQVGITYAPEKHSDHGYSVTAGLSNYITPKFSTYSSSSLDSAAQSAASHTSSNSYSSILSSPKVPIVIGGHGGYAYGSGNSLGYGGISALKAAHPVAIKHSFKHIPIIPAKVAPVIQYAPKSDLSSNYLSTNFKDHSVDNSLFSHGSVKIYSQPSAHEHYSYGNGNKYSLASDVSKIYSSLESVSPAVHYAPSVSTDYKSSSDISSSLSHKGSSSFSYSSGNLGQIHSKTVHTAPQIVSKPSLGSSYSYSLGHDSSSGLSHGDSSSYSYSSGNQDKIHGLSHSSGSLNHGLSHGSASSFSHSTGNLGQSHHGSNLNSGVLHGGASLISHSSDNLGKSYHGSGLSHGSASSFSHSTGNLGQIDHGSNLNSGLSHGGASLVSHSSGNLDGLHHGSGSSHGGSSSFSYSSGNLGAGKKVLAVPAASVSYAPVSNNGHGLIGAAPTATTYVTSDGKTGKEHYGKEKHGKYYNAHPHYYFEYHVNDPHTGDVKEQKERREGDVVKGEYSLVEPDGNVRTVTYQADWETGFHAKVTNSKESKKSLNFKA